jgi:T4 RnlA family RNA ligase
MQLPDDAQFNFKDCVIGGDDCILITPNNISCKWTPDNLQFRSIILRKNDYKIISRGFKKFFNWPEQPDIDPFPSQEFDAYEKKDGSLIIWGIHNSQLIHRTRGTVTLETLANGHEIGFLKQKYPALITAIYENPEYSILTEWETPNNVIVLRDVDEPTLTLIGAIHNDTGELLPQCELDKTAEAWGLSRPKKYPYHTVSDCIADVQSWVGVEGVVVYSPDGQSLRKIKSAWYCEMHKLAAGFSNIDALIDVFISSPMFTKYSEFYNYIETTIDHEIAERVKDNILKIVVAYCKALEAMKNVRSVVDGVRGSSFSRKDQAQEIVLHWNDWRKTYGFLILDDKKLPDTFLKNIIKHYL